MQLISSAQMSSSILGLKVDQAPCSPSAAGQKLKQKKALVVPATAALDVLEDEDLAAAQAGAPGRAGAAPQGTLRQRLDAGDLQEHLRQDPLRLHKAGSLPSSVLLAGRAYLRFDAHALP